MGARRIVAKTKPQQALQEKRLAVTKLLGTACLTRRLLGAALLIGGVGGSLGFVAWQLAQADTLPIHQVQVKGEFRYLDKADLYAAIGGQASAGFFNVDVQAIKRSAEAMPWVDSASVRRIWPDTLQVEIREQVPLARWQSGGIVNQRGELVAVAVSNRLHDLPLFSGPADTAMSLAKHYQQMSAQLAEVQLRIVQLTLSERRAWMVSLDNGLQLLLGKVAAEEQFSRFTHAYNGALAAKLANVQSVDLRYTNGFAVRWKTPAVS